jgi:3',5'-cyclic AMP phosphodiesterase CpdA
MSRTLVHLSDIHFGTVDPAILAPLIDAVRQMQPDVVVVSGDLTQRARAAEFLEARAFLDRLPQPRIVVPGNHDVPLYNLYGRFIERLDKYQRYITTDMEPEYSDSEIAVLGVNTARSLTWKGGRVNSRQLARLKERLCGIDSRVTKVVVTHHPFDLPTGFSRQHVVGGARRAMVHLAQCGADLLLSGHMHVSSVSQTVLRYQIAGHSALVVQAGTATSTRGRGELNSFNCIRIERGLIAIERWSWSREAGVFATAGIRRYQKIADGWEPAAMSSLVKRDGT